MNLSFSLQHGKWRNLYTNTQCLREYLCTRSLFQTVETETHRFECDRVTEHKNNNNEVNQ